MTTLSDQRKNKFVNRFPDCVYLSPTIQKSGKDKFGVYFMIVFGEHIKRDSIFGEIGFGIKGGELQIELQNCSVDPRGISFMKEFALKTEIGAVEEGSDAQSSHKKHAGQIKGALGIMSSVDSAGSIESEVGREAGQKRVKTFTTTMNYIKANWHPTKPRWMFYPQLWDTVLEGKLDHAKFFTLSANDAPFIIGYKFTVKPRDIILTDVYPFSSVETANKKVILRLFIARVILKIQNILSEGSLAYNG